MTDDSDPDETLIDLSLPLETICMVIAKAREFDVKEGSTDPDASALDDDDIPAAALEDRPSDPVEQELRELISDLSEDGQIDLVALMWLGRDEGSVEDWAELRENAAQAHNEHTAGYLCGTPLLPDYLEAGLSVAGLDCDDVFRGHL